MDNLSTIIGGIIIAIATTLYHKVRGDKAADIGARVKKQSRDLADLALHTLIVTAESHPDELRAKAEEYVWFGLSKLGVPRNAITSPFVGTGINEAIVHAIALAKEHDHEVELAAADASAQLKASLVGWDEILAKATAEAARPLPGPDAEAPAPAPAVTP